MSFWKDGILSFRITAEAAQAAGDTAPDVAQFGGKAESYLPSALSEGLRDPLRDFSAPGFHKGNQPFQ